MRGKAELVKRRRLADRVAAFDENSREALGAAGNRDHDRRSARHEGARLGFGPDPRRIEQHAVEGVEFGRAERTLEEVARLRLERAQAPRLRGGAPQRGDGGGVGVGGEDLVGLGQAQRESAGAAEEIGDAPRVLQRVSSALGQRTFSRLRRLQEAAGRRPGPRPAEGDLRRGASSAPAPRRSKSRPARLAGA